jgi:hypothetical protein
MVAAVRTSKHGGSSANPPAASLYGEHNTIVWRMRLALLTMGFHERRRPYKVPGFSEARGTW